MTTLIRLSSEALRTDARNELVRDLACCKCETSKADLKSGGYAHLLEGRKVHLICSDCFQQACLESQGCCPACQTPYQNQVLDYSSTLPTQDVAVQVLQGSARRSDPKSLIGRAVIAGAIAVVLSSVALGVGFRDERYFIPAGVVLFTVCFISVVTSARGEESRRA